MEKLQFISWDSVSTFIMLSDYVRGTILSVEVGFTFSFLIGSEDGKLSCGYSSFRGKRASMEDFYDVKTSKIDGQSVYLFGIFDGSSPLCCPPA